MEDLSISPCAFYNKESRQQLCKQNIRSVKIVILQLRQL